jgi:hypothetical protein
MKKHDTKTSITLEKPKLSDPQTKLSKENSQQKLSSLLTDKLYSEYGIQLRTIVLIS